MGGRVFRVGFDSGVILFVARDDILYEIALAGPFTFHPKPAHERTVDPRSSQVRELCDIIDLREGGVTSCVVRKGGELELVFTGDRAISIAPNEDFDAWEISGTDGSLVVAISGGGIAAWNGEAKYPLG